MTIWISTPFVQALGWATLNSIWQMALLWLCFLVLTSFFKITPARKHSLALGGILAGFAWFLFTFAAFYLGQSQTTTTIFSPLSLQEDQLSSILSAASLAYLILLVFPARRILLNWLFVQKIKRSGLQKISGTHRLFVEKISRHLGINKPVRLYISSLVTSPLTIGFLKPVILLPLSAVTNLAPRQLEAILLHELAHIRRHDYLLNLFLSFIHVVLYFNPFVRLFLQKLELERETCCDEMVLQFEYDKLSYASALVQLEKTSRSLQLAMGAANKAHLLHRIENIVGMHKKQSLSTNQLTGVLGGLLMLIVVNALIFTRKEASAPSHLAGLSQPFAFFVDQTPAKSSEDNMARSYASLKPVKKGVTNMMRTVEAVDVDHDFIDDADYSSSPVASDFMHVSYDAAAVQLDAEQKTQVRTTVANTQKVLEIQWSEIEKSIGDGMTAREKKLAKQDYLREIRAIDWQKIEKNLEAGYDQLDWNKINGTVSEVFTSAKLDSLETSYKMALEELNRKAPNCAVTALPMPDVSEQQILKAKTELKVQISDIRKSKNKKVVKL